MLVLPSDPRWNDGPPAVIDTFRQSVAEHLGDAWNVRLTAYDNDAPDEQQAISAEVQATHGDVLLSITRHAGFDMVLVELRGATPRTVPFEDLAAVCGWVSRDEVLGLALQDPKEEFGPVLPLGEALDRLDQCREELQAWLTDEHVAAQLQSMSDEFASRLTRPPREIGGLGR